MSQETTPDKVHELMAALGAACRRPGKIYFSGGTSALLLGLRDATIDVDMKLHPEPEGVYEALAAAKASLGINIELACPDDFIPPLPGWRKRSPLIERHGKVSFYHYDFYGQALAKIERGHVQDRLDVAALIRHGYVVPTLLQSFFAEIIPELIRYPEIDPAIFRDQVAVTVGSAIATGNASG